MGSGVSGRCAFCKTAHKPLEQLYVPTSLRRSCSGRISNSTELKPQPGFRFQVILGFLGLI